MRFMATGQLVDELLTVVLEQKVTQQQARGMGLVGAYLVTHPRVRHQAAPDPQTVLGIASWRWHTGWVQPFMARTLKTVASRASALQRLAHQPLDRIQCGAQFLTRNWPVDSCRNTTADPRGGRL